MKDRSNKTDKRLSDEPESVNSNGEQLWAEGVIREHLNARVDSLDADVTARLSAARQLALAQSVEDERESDGSSRRGFSSDSRQWSRKKSWEWSKDWWLDRSNKWFGWSVAGSGLAAAVVFAVLILKLLPSEPPGLDTAPVAREIASLDNNNRAIEDMQMLSASDELEFFQTLELLEWIDSNAG